MLAKQWLLNVRTIMDTIEETQMDNIRRAAEVMANSIEAGRWVHTFGFVGFHPMMAFVTTVWMTVITVAEILAERGVKLFIHPSHNVPGDSTAKERLEEALAEYKKRVAGV